jgi:hypothetical protein
LSFRFFPLVRLTNSTKVAYEVCQTSFGQRQSTPSARQATEGVQTNSRVRGTSAAVQSSAAAHRRRARLAVYNCADSWKTTSLQEPHSTADTTDDDDIAPHSRSALRTHSGDRPQDARSATTRRAYRRTAREPANGSGHRRSNSWDSRSKDVMHNHVDQAASAMVRTFAGSVTHHGTKDAFSCRTDEGIWLPIVSELRIGNQRGPSQCQLRVDG